MSRNSLDSSSATSRIKAQQPLSTKLRYADYVLDNSGTLPELLTQLSSLVGKLRNRTRGLGFWFSWLLPVWGALKGLWIVWYRMRRIDANKASEDKGRRTRGERSEVEVELKRMERERERGRGRD